MNTVLDQSLVGWKYILVSSEVHQYQVSAIAFNHGEDVAGKLNPSIVGLYKKNSSNTFLSVLLQHLAKQSYALNSAVGWELTEQSPVCKSLEEQSSLGSTLSP